MKKTEGYVCPKCGATGVIEDWDLDCDSLWLNLSCSECDEVWYETHKLKYESYRCNGKSYDKDGNEENE